MVARWKLVLLVLFMPLLLAGCLRSRYDFCFGGPCAGGGGPLAPPIDTSPWLGTWVNEDPQPEQVSRFELFEKDDGKTYGRVWQVCTPSDCEFDEAETWGTFWERKRVLDVQAFRGGADIWHVHLRLSPPSDDRVQAVVTYATRTTVVESDTYPFVRQPNP